MKFCQRTFLTILLIVFSTILILNTAFAQPMAGADVAYKSKYVWRGIPFNTESVLWPDAWGYWNGFTFVLFGSMELTDIYDNSMTFTELDYYLDYTKAFGKINATLGYAHYTYPNTDFKTTGEIYLKANTDLEFVQIGLSAYKDIIEAEGFYISPQISKSFAKCPVNPKLSLSLGYADKNHNGYWMWVEKAGLTDITGTLCLSYAPSGTLGEYVSFGADLNYSTIPTGDLADVFGDDDSNFWFGLSVNFARTLGGE